MPFLRPTYIIAILIAIAVHECAHAFAANRLGDPTAENQGRLTLNPIAHIDPLGALMFVIIGFGWAKPVPVNPMYFRHPNRDMAITALAGPFSNLILAAVAFVLLWLTSGTGASSISDLLAGASDFSSGQQVMFQVLRDSLFVNLALMAFNLLPIAPLDGSNILRIAIPRNLQDRYDDWIRIGPWVLLALIIVESFLPVSIISGWVFGIMSFVLSVFGMIVGG
jgi:Zn-dependent protease